MKYFVLFFAISAIFFSCQKEVKEGEIAISINHKVADKDFNLYSENHLSKAGHPYSIDKLWYYLSEITFVQIDGTEQVFHKAHLVKAEKKDTYRFVNEKVKSGEYNKIKFRFGFTKENNKVDYLDNTVDDDNMKWFDDNVYHYMKFEGTYDPNNQGNETKYFKMHYGPTDGNDNSFEVSLDIPNFEVNDNSYDLVINMDLQEWSQNPTEYDFEEYTMVMMKQNVQEIFKANGKTVFSFKELKANEK